MRFRNTSFTLKVCLVAAIAAATLAVPVYGYVTSRILAADQSVTQLKWKSFPIVWEMNTTRGANVTGARDQAEVFRAAFAPWQAVGTSTINFSEASTAGTRTPGFDGFNLISTNVTPAEYASSAVGFAALYFFDVGNVVAGETGQTVDFAGQIMDSDIIFNPAELFSTEASTIPVDRFDLQSVATHEVGHLLGLDHTSITSATMFWATGQGTTHSRVLTSDDIAGISSIYPGPGFAAKGTISGTVRTTANTAVYGAIVTAVNANGQPVASAITDPQGNYSIGGLDAGSYSIYAAPLDQPLEIGNVPTLTLIYPGATIFKNFTTRFR